MADRFPADFAIEELRQVLKPSLKQSEKMIARRSRYLIRRIGDLKASIVEKDRQNAEMLRRELASIVVVMEDVEKRTTRVVHVNKNAEAERFRLATWLRRIAPQFWNGQRDCDPEDLAECLEKNELEENWGAPT